MQWRECLLKFFLNNDTYINELQLHLENFGTNEEHESLQKWALRKFDEVERYSVLNISMFTPCQYFRQFLNGLPFRPVMLFATLDNLVRFSVRREQANTRSTNDTANSVVILLGWYLIRTTYGTEYSVQVLDVTKLFIVY